MYCMQSFKPSRRTLFVCSVLASSVAESDEEEAKQLGRASLGLSIAGIIVTLIVAAFIIGLVLSDNYDGYFSYCNNYGCYYTGIW